VAALGLFVAAWRAQRALQFAVPRLPNAAWMLAAGGALFAVWLVAARRAPAEPTPLSRRVEWLAVLALCGLGTWFRLVHFGSVPEGMNHDAAFNGMFALNALQGAPYTPYISAAWGRETLFMYLCTALVWLLGNVPEPIQIAATLVGLATLPIFYAFARAIVGQRLALLGLALLAVSGWHTLFSRVGWRMIMVPPFEMLALLGLWRGLAGRRWGWVLAGFGAAGAIYTYDAGRMVPLVVGALWVLGAAAEPRRWRERGLGALVVLGVFLIVGSTMLHYAATHFEQFKGRASALAEQRESEHTGVLANVATAMTMFHYRGNGNDFFIEEPLLEPLAAVLFGLGLLVALMRVGRPAERFMVAGFALALLPGVLASPNGNRCITALPFVYVFAAMGLAALLDVLLLPLGRSAAPNAAAQRRLLATAALAALLIAVAGGETYAEFLGAGRRRILGFSPEATAAGTYLRQFDQARYARYVVAEDWPDYTLTYLSYNGGGTPMEGHYVLGRRLEDIADQINRYGRKGLVFATDLKPAGQAALQTLQREFADRRVEPILAARLDNRPVGAALIVEPQSAAQTALWSNTTRALAIGGDSAAHGARCFDPVGGADGMTLRLQIMRPAPSDAAGGTVALLDRCPPAAARPLLTLSFTPRGLEAIGKTSSVLLPLGQLEAGRWYDVVLSLSADGRTSIWLDRQPVPGVQAAAAPRLGAIAVRAPQGARFYLDDVVALAGSAKPDDDQWHVASRPQGSFGEDFETTPLGLLASAGDWSDVAGPLAALASPAPPAAAPDAAAPGDGGNAFDGGHGAEAGQFDQPMGLAVDRDGTLFVADRNNHRIQVFSRAGDFKRVWGRAGNAPGEFKEPHAVAVDDEFVYVADTWNQRIQGFLHDGTPMFAFTGQPSLSSPRGLAVANRHIYVAESGAARVTVYDRDGHLLQTFGERGSNAGQLIEPTDVAVDAHGDVWVLNTGNNRVEHFAADGRVLGSIPIPGWSGPRMKEVYLAIDAKGVLYVGDWDLGGVRRFQPDGRELEPIGSKVREPSGIVVERDRVLVAGRGDDVVHVVPLDGAR